MKYLINTLKNLFNQKAKFDISKKIKTSAIFLLFILTFKAGFSQVTDFKLKDYKYRTKGYRAKIFQLDSKEMLNNYKFKENDTMSNFTEDLFLGGSMGFQYNYYSDKRIHTCYFEPTVNLSFDNLKNLSKRNIKGSVLLKGIYSQRDVWYKKKNYFEITQTEHIETQILKSNDDFKQINEKFRFLQPGIDITLGIGKGRVEYVQDAQTALFILEDLFKKKIIQTKVDEQVALNFAKLITDIRNKRRFDYRIRLIYELTRLDSFLKANKILKSTGIDYFTTLNDNWLYAFQGLGYQQIRNSGTVRFLKLNYILNNEYKKDKVTDTTGEQIFLNSIINPKIYLIAGIEKYIPIDLNWQKNYGINAKISHNKLIRKSNIRPTNPELNDISFSVTSFYDLDYYPNTRTIVSLNTLAEYNYSNNKHGKINANNEVTIYKGTINEIMTKASISGSYFISYTSRIMGYVAIDATKFFSENLNTISFSFSFNISYSHMFY